MHIYICVQSHIIGQRRDLRELYSINYILFKYLKFKIIITKRKYRICILITTIYKYVTYDTRLHPTKDAIEIKYTDDDVP